MSIAAIGGFCLIILIQLHKSAEAEAWVLRTEQVLAEANGAMERIDAAENNTRGFLLTRDGAFLRRFDEILASAAGQLDRLRELTADNDVQQAQLGRLAPMVEAKYGSLRDMLAVARQGRLDDMATRWREAAGGVTTEQLRQGFAEVMAIERDLLARRKVEAAVERRRVELGVTAGGAIAALLVFLAALHLALPLSSAFRALLDGIALVGTGALHHRLADGSNDEIGSIARAFNGMAAQLATVRQVHEGAEAELQRINAQLRSHGAELERRSTVVDLLGKMAHRLQAAASESEFAEVVGRFVPQILPDTAGALYLLNNSRNLLQCAVEWGEPHSGGPVFTPGECWGVRRGQPHRVTDWSHDVCCRHVDGAGGIQYVCLPLLARGDIVGLLYLEADAGKTLAREGRDDSTQVLVENIALALVNHRLRESLKEQSVRDVLTGLFNRRYLEETLQLECARALRAETSVGVLMIDVDRFKQFNDSFGHEAGDLVLRAVAQEIKGRVRGGDLVCRYGGEEFVVVMPGATTAQAVERAEMLRQAVREMMLSHRGEALGGLSISVGVAVLPDHGNTPAAVLAAADAALYQAKDEGRDRVLTATAEAA